MGLETQLPTLITVLTTAAIDAVNPCAIGVLILMMSVVLGGGGSPRRLLFLGAVYIFSVFATYLIFGLGLLYIFDTLPLVITEGLSVAIGFLVVFAGILEIKDFFWYGKGWSLHIPGWAARMIQRYAQRTTVLGVAFLGAFVSAVELPCTGGPYLAIITLLSQNWNPTAFLMMVLYNVVFVSPLIIMLIMVAAGVQLGSLKSWKQGARGTMRLMIGLVLIALGWLLMLIANGTINLN